MGNEQDNRERGAVLVLVAASAVVLMGMAAFAIDIGWILLNNARAQRAADAAALGGVVFLPALPAEANQKAIDIARVNDYDVADGVTTVTPVRVDVRELEVGVTKRIPTFFMQVFGVDTVQVSASARAKYVPPVPLGSQADYFGIDPTTPGLGPGEAGSPNFWASIQGPFTRKRHGDPYATQCFTQASGADVGRACVSANGEYYGSTRGAPDGYWYGVEVPEGAPSFTVQVYDASMVERTDFDDATGDVRLNMTPQAFGALAEVQIITHDATGGTYTLTFDGDTTDPIAVGGVGGQPEEVGVLDALEALDAIGDVSVSPLGGGRFRVSFNNPLGDLPEMTVDGSLLDPPGSTIEVTTDRDGADAGPTTTYRLYAPDGTPFDHRDNPEIGGCARSLTSGNQATRDSWISLCTLSNPTPGVYPLRVYTSGAGSAWNNYSLRIAPSGTGVRLYGLERMSIYTNIPSGTATFDLAEVDAALAGTNLELEVYDPGDLEIPGPNATSNITILGPGGSAWTGGCSIQAAPEGPGEPSYSTVELKAPGQPCVIDTTRLSGADRYQGRWVRAVIPLTGYTCAGSEADPDCWWQVRYDYASAVLDRTTWRAQVAGNLVSLVFAED